MTNPETSPAKPLGSRAAILLGSSLLISLLVVTLFAASNRVERTSLETFQRVTAVGDTAYISVPKDAAKAPLPVATLRGQPLFASSPEPAEARDSRMELVDRDVKTGVGIYAATEPVETDQGERPRAGEILYFLKVKTDEYLMVGPNAPSQ
jgi:hypothetical protein